MLAIALVAVSTDPSDSKVGQSTTVLAISIVVNVVSTEPCNGKVG